jgi:protein-S-isoprenylcysteine O-methyltransferase Ste14
VFLAVFGAVSFVPSMYWALRSPEVLRRRMRAGPIAETRRAQKVATVGTITMEADQPVITTGLYGIGQHPMYAFALLMIAGMPLSLGSYWALVTVAPAVAVLAFRIDDEEKLLREELAGYREYTAKVHYRLVPAVW